MAPMLELEKITKDYGKGVRAVDSLSLTLREGEIFGFLGPNGAGKSTTIRMLVNILTPTEGDILYNGVSVYKDITEYKRHLAYVPDEPSFYQNLTGYQYLDFIADIYGVPASKRKERVEEYSSMFSLEKALSDKVKSYSHGMGQKLNLIAALIHEPEILILDEPMVGLDPRASREVKDLMRRRASEGAIVFFSTHVLEVAQGLCDRIGIIDKGQLIREGSVDELLEAAHDSSLEEFFLSVTEV